MSLKSHTKAALKVLAVLAVRTPSATKGALNPTPKLARNALLGSRKLDEDLTSQVEQPETVLTPVLCEDNLAVCLPFAHRAVVCPHTPRDMGTCRLLQLSEVVLGSGSGASH